MSELGRREVAVGEYGHQGGVGGEEIVSRRIEQGCVGICESGAVRGQHSGDLLSVGVDVPEAIQHDGHTYPE